MAEAPLSLLLEGGGLLLIAEDRLLAPGVRLRHARVRPTGAVSPTELLSGGPGRIARLLARPVIVERCVFGIRGEAIAEALTRRLRGLVIAGLEIVDVDVELHGTRLPALDLRVRLRAAAGPSRILARTWARGSISGLGGLASSPAGGRHGCSPGHLRRPGRSDGRCSHGCSAGAGPRARRDVSARRRTSPASERR